jgi:hypothetical protein
VRIEPLGSGKHRLNNGRRMRRGVCRDESGDRFEIIDRAAKPGYLISHFSSRLSISV